MSRPGATDVMENLPEVWTEENLPKVWPEGVKLLILVDESESATAGGIVIPHRIRDNNQLKLTMGTVLRLGPDAAVRMGDGKECGPGSRIIFARYGGYRLSELETRRDLRIINDEDVLALLEDDWV